MNYIFILFTCIISFNIDAQKILLQAGPMLGYSDFREVLIWVQTTEAADVQIEYWTKAETKKKTDIQRTHQDQEFIVKIFPTEVDYGTSYQYDVYINNKKLDFSYPLEFTTQTLWQWRTDPPAINFAIGSCTYVSEEKDDRPGTPYGSEYQIFSNILKKDPDFMVWLGDNTYLREPDFFSKRGILHRYKHTRSLKEMQALLASVHHYALWDDHDYGPNNSNKSYVYKDDAFDAFKLYWGNPNMNVTKKGGITGMFQWGDVQFYLMDNRYHRSPNEQKGPNKELLGKSQIDWLIDALTSSRAPFKFVCIGGQTIHSQAIYENYAVYDEERQYLFERIAEEKIEGVIFLSGDRHHSEISKMKRPEAYPLYDITNSPLTSGTHKPKDEGNIHLVEGTLYNEKNFGMINISGPRRDRMLTYTLFSNEGKQVYVHKIKAAELRYKK